MIFKRSKVEEDKVHVQDLISLSCYDLLNKLVDEFANIYTFLSSKLLDVMEIQVNDVKIHKTHIEKLKRLINLIQEFVSKCSS